MSHLKRDIHQIDMFEEPIEDEDKEGYDTVLLFEHRDSGAVAGIISEESGLEVQARALRDDYLESTRIIVYIRQANKPFGVVVQGKIVARFGDGETQIVLKKDLDKLNFTCLLCGHKFSYKHTCPPGSRYIQWRKEDQ